MLKRFTADWAPALALALVSVAAHWSSALASGALQDPDGYMRLVRVEKLLADGAWQDHSMPRSNAPAGDELHWSRAMDVVLLAGAAPLAPWLGWRQALWVWGMGTSPVLHAAAALLLAGFWARRGPHRAMIAAIVLAQPALLQSCGGGHPDHHALLLFFAAAVAGLARLCLAGRARLRHAALLGLAGAGGLWTSIEFAPVALLAAAAVSARAVLKGTEAAGRAAAFFVVLAAGVAAAALSETGWQAVGTTPADRLGAQHALLTAWAALAWMAYLPAARRLRSPWLRGGLLAALSATAAAAALATAPGLLADPHGVPAALRPLWLDHVREMQPLAAAGNPVAAVGLWLFAVACLGAAGLLRLALRTRPGPVPRSLSGWWHLTALGLFGLAAWFHLRWVAYAELFGTHILATTALVLHRKTRCWQAGLPRAAGGAAVVLLASCGYALFLPLIVPPPAGPSRSPAAASGPGQEASLAALAAWAAGQPRWNNATVLAPVDDGPEWLYRAPVRVIATPYHRNVSGIRDSHAIMAGADPGEARRLALSRGVDFIVWSTAPGAAAFWEHLASPQSLLAELRRGAAPEWLRPVALPPHLQGAFRVYETVGPADP